MMIVCTAAICPAAVDAHAHVRPHSEATRIIMLHVLMVHVLENGKPALEYLCQHAPDRYSSHLHLF